MTISISTQLSKNSALPDDLDLSFFTKYLSERSSNSTCFSYELPGPVVLSPELEALMDDNLVESPKRFSEKDAAVLRRDGMIDDDGVISILVSVGIKDYLDAYAHGFTSLENHLDLIHNSVFDFGLPSNCTVLILGVIPSSLSQDSNDFLVLYTTDIGEYLTI